MFPENHAPLARRQHRFHGSSHAQLSPATWLQSVTRPAPSMDKCPGFWGTDPPPNHDAQTQISPDQKLLLCRGQESVCHPTATAQLLNSLLAAFY